MYQRRADLADAGRIRSRSARHGERSGTPGAASSPALPGDHCPESNACLSAHRTTPRNIQGFGRLPPEQKAHPRRKAGRDRIPDRLSDRLGPLFWPLDLPARRTGDNVAPGTVWESNLGHPTPSLRQVLAPSCLSGTRSRPAGHRKSRRKSRVSILDH